MSLTFQDMDKDTGHISIRWAAGIVSRIGGFCVFNPQTANSSVVSCLLKGNVYPARVEIYHPRVVVPKYVGWRLRAISDHACQVDLTSDTHIEISATQYFRFRHCKIMKLNGNYFIKKQISKEIPYDCRAWIGQFSH
ncbi:hypothetical protein AVEN_204059-1 [Araneus ventricosus]|uniref:Uncharacterized protein n=1 Tax=Araneus ventricosus TaxID=182803 RepID=A0A4Y2BGI3_ARAVE|nr:hypothetical protein AVEN_2148-1 [Araneus ventricosus]GBL91361.1 hypothetical protein AVEN_110840-1 [Araneus ventricosus]GBL91364.1 hypothetical protein AVEN_115790-1 [Araneus ventricosus]GBL91410.1 hypothetical protein AVEN_204059-1 [Araneus ventricosus]